MKKKILIGVFIFIFLAIAGFAGYVWLTLHWSYSTGERAGYVQKFSQKGWICKTWEGELTMMAVPASMSLRVRPLSTKPFSPGFMVVKAKAPATRRIWKRYSTSNGA